MTWILASMHLPLVADKGGGSFFSGTDGAADGIALGSLIVSVISLHLSWQAARHVKVWFEPAQADGKHWLTAVVRNPGGAVVRITGWGVLASSQRLYEYKELNATETVGSPSLDAPDRLPYELPPGGSIRLSWETANVIQEYRRARAGGDPARVRVFIRVGWKQRKIKSRLSNRWPTT
jgi:hypothetical protein